MVVLLLVHVTQEQERAAILDSYQALSEQAERLDCTVQQSVKNQSSFQLELSVLVQVQTNQPCNFNFLVILDYSTYKLVGERFSEGWQYMLCLLELAWGRGEGGDRGVISIMWPE